MATSNEHSQKTKVVRIALIWLDPEVHDNDNEYTRELLNKNFGRCKFLMDVQECHKFILHSPSQAKLVLVVSGQLGRQLVPLIHDQSNLSSIYVYCQWKEEHEKWAINHKKVKGVITDLNELISQVRADHETS